MSVPGGCITYGCVCLLQSPILYNSHQEGFLFSDKPKESGDSSVWTLTQGVLAFEQIFDIKSKRKIKMTSDTPASRFGFCVSSSHPSPPLKYQTLLPARKIHGVMMGCLSSHNSQCSPTCLLKEAGFSSRGTHILELLPVNRPFFKALQLLPCQILKEK